MMNPFAELRALRAKVAELEEQVRNVPHLERQPAGPLGDVYFHQCGKCGKERQLDISPARVLENHTMQLEEDRHRAWLHELSSPEAERLRAQQAAELREDADARERAAAREARALAMQDQVELLGKLSTGPWSG